MGGHGRLPRVASADVALHEGRLARVWARSRRRSRQELAACLREGLPSDGERARAAAERHRLHIDTWFYPCSHDMQVGLADMYVADPRFRARYDDIEGGLAEYVHDAIVANALDHIA